MSMTKEQIMSRVIAEWAGIAEAEADRIVRFVQAAHEVERVFPGWTAGLAYRLMPPGGEEAIVAAVERAAVTASMVAMAGPAGSDG